MTNKILIFLSLIIIILAALSLKANQEAAAPKIVEVKPTMQIYELKKDIAKNRPVLKKDLEAKDVEYDEKYLKDGYVLNESALDLKKARIDLKKGEALKQADLKDMVLADDETNPAKLKDASKANAVASAWVDIEPFGSAFNVAKGYVAYAFDLSASELEVLRNINENELVDIYYLYQSPADRNKGLIAKLDERPGMVNKDIGNNTHLKVLFKDKKLLALKRSIKASKNSNYVATAFFELDTNEAKIAYTAAPLGKFLFFPANDNDANSYSIKKILPSKFIKEIRGDK